MKRGEATFPTCAPSRTPCTHTATTTPAPNSSWPADPCVLAYTETTPASGANLRPSSLHFALTYHGLIGHLPFFSSLFFTFSLASIQDHPLFLKGLRSIDVILSFFVLVLLSLNFHLPIFFLISHLFLCVTKKRQRKKQRCDPGWCLISWRVLKKNGGGFLFCALAAWTFENCGIV